MTAFLLLLFIFKSVSSYNIQWSSEFTYYDGGSRNPYTINIRGEQNSSLVICFEELTDDKYSGLCEGAQLDVVNTNIAFGPKTIFQLENASNPYEIQIYGANGWTNYFLLAYTNGENRAEGPGKLLMGQYLSDGRILYSTDQVTFNPYLNDQSNLIELQNNSYFIVCASVGPRNQYDTACKIGKYDTSTMTVQLGTKVFNMSMGHTTHGMAVHRINAYTFLSCFGEFLAKRGVCFVGTVTDNFINGLQSDIKFGNEIVLDEDGGVDEVQIRFLSNDVLAICYKTYTAGRCRLAQTQKVGDTEVYTVVIGDEKFDFEDDTVDSPSMFRVEANSLDPAYDNPELLVVCHVDADKGACKFGEVDLDAMTIKFDEEDSDEFADRGVGTVNAIYLQETKDKMVVCYIKFAGSTPLFNRGLCKYGTITAAN